MMVPTAPAVPECAYRPTEERDVPALCTFAQSAQELFFLYPKADYPLTPDQLRRAITEHTANTVAVVDGKVAGFANFCRWQTRGVCAIGYVMIAPQYRRQGVGTRLMTAMIGTAFTRFDASEVQVACFAANTAALALYEKMGFQRCGEERRFDKAGDTTTLINLKLPRSQWRG